MRIATRPLARALGAVAALTALVGACGGGDDPGSTTLGSSAAPSTVPIAVVLGGGVERARVAVGSDCLDVAVADTPAERATGLSRRDDLGSLDGMLFVWDVDTDSEFWMYETRLPLTIGWYGADGAPVDRAELEPCPARDPAECPRYGARGRYRYALEVGAGALPAGALGGCP